MALRKAAFVFPGQGSQRVGMGRELYELAPAARAVFEEADEALGFPLTRLIFEGPQESLKETVNAQPAILTVSAACLAAARERGHEALSSGPLFVAGHSLGEYTALVAAGVLDLSSTVRLVRERGRLMQEAGQRNPGGMAAILGLDDAVVEDVCRQAGAEIANVNAPGNITISGRREALAWAMDLARARGAKRCIPLEVSGAFHSSLMEYAVQSLKQVLDETEFRDPQVPVVLNGSAEPTTSAQELKDELVRQVCTPVQWRRSVEFMIEAGVDTFVELGPGGVLTGLIKRINGQVDTVNLGDGASIIGVQE